MKASALIFTLFSYLCFVQCDNVTPIVLWHGMGKLQRFMDHLGYVVVGLSIALSVATPNLIMCCRILILKRLKVINIT